MTSSVSFELYLARAKMCKIEMKLFLVLSMLLVCSHSESVQPRIRLADGTALKYRDLIYILYGEPLELYCTGQDHELQMTVDVISRLPTTTVNKTTIRYFEQKPEKSRGSYYKCEYNKSVVTANDFSAIFVVVDSLPVAYNFRCKSMNLEYVNCSWTTKNFHAEHWLYYEADGIPTLLCKTERFDQSKYCIWDQRYPLLPYQRHVANLTFYMKTCSGVGCTNQTFVFDHRAIVVLDAPKLTVLSKNSYGAIIRWFTLIDHELKDFNLELKTSFWYSGIHQNLLNVPFIVNDEAYSRTAIGDIIVLELPCANEFYEVRMSVRPQLAEEEDFWSDEAVISFVTEPVPEGADARVDPTCNRPRAKITTDVMLYKIDELIEKVKKEQNELKAKINSMKLKFN